MSPSAERSRFRVSRGIPNSRRRALNNFFVAASSGIRHPCLVVSVLGWFFAIDVFCSIYRQIPTRAYSIEFVAASSKKLPYLHLVRYAIIALLVFSLLFYIDNFAGGGEVVEASSVVEIDAANFPVE